MSSSFYSRSESSRGHKHSSGKDSKHRKHHSSKPSGPMPGTGPRRFLFVVNEIRFEPDFDQFPLDSWLNHVPPGVAEAYAGEYAGRVFQYEGGRVSPAPEYLWYRPGPGFPGGIGRHGPNGSFHMMVPYKTGTVFACSPHLPIIVAECDVSCDPTFLFKYDCNCNNNPGGVDGTRWNILCFDKTNGFSQVNAVSVDSPYVFRGNPSWIPSLVPRVYENPDENSRSTGLGGDLATLIGLMAFHGRRGRASDVFSSGGWQQHQWHGSQRAPSGYPSPPHPEPRGFVVHIALDMLLEGFDEDALENMKADFGRFEWSTVFVRG